MKGAFNSDIADRKIVAYCPYHKWTMTAKQMNRIKCIKRKCPLLKRLDNVYWDYIDKKEKEKQEKREKIKSIWKNP